MRHSNYSKRLNIFVILALPQDILNIFQMYTYVYTADLLYIFQAEVPGIEYRQSHRHLSEFQYKHYIVDTMVPSVSLVMDPPSAEFDCTNAYVCSVHQAKQRQTHAQFQM